MKKFVQAATLSLLCAAISNVEDLSAESAQTCTGLSLSAVTSAKETSFSSCLTLREIELLPNRQFETSTIWTDGIHHFEGVPLYEVLKHIEGGFTAVKLAAENDYAVVVPATEIGPNFPIVALRMNGQALDQTDKGPLWVVYPYDRAAEFRTSRALSQSVWMLSSIEAYQ